MKCRFAMFLIVMLIVGCENGQILMSAKDREKIKASKIATATKRHELFVECLELAAKIIRKGDDDVSDIVDECGTQSLYMANHFK